MNLFIHSISDIITNSSTEIYTVATEDTITCVKRVINDLLSLGGGRYTADDLFDISLSVSNNLINATLNEEEYPELILNSVTEYYSQKASDHLKELFKEFFENINNAHAYYNKHLENLAINMLTYYRDNFPKAYESLTEDFSYCDNVALEINVKSTVIDSNAKKLAEKIGKSLESAYSWFDQNASSDY